MVCSKRQSMFRVDVEDVPPPPSSANVQSTSYRVLPSGNLGSTSRVLDVPLSPQHNNNFEDLSTPVDDSVLWNDEPWVESDQLDPAYLEHLNTDHVAARRPRIYVCTFSQYYYFKLLNRFWQRNPLKKWLPAREEFLSEFLRWEGRGDYMTAGCFCCESPKPDARYRCLDCDSGQTLCQRCIVSTHRTNPLHRIEVCIRCFKHPLDTDFHFELIALDGGDLLCERDPQILRPAYPTGAHGP